MVNATLTRSRDLGFGFCGARQMTTVYTIGYEGTDIDKIVATLHAVGVKVMADVRAVALSRKKGFSKNALRNRLEAEGIGYVHFVELGDPKPGREAAKAGHFDQFKRIYNAHLVGHPARAALDLLEETVQGAPVCMLCFERDPKTCHRTIVADRLKARGIEVVDLFGDDPGRYVHHAPKLSRRNARQGDAQPQPEIR
jgi:uncharacterized protein (DUF488 family)